MRALVIDACATDAGLFRALRQCGFSVESMTIGDSLVAIPTSLHDLVVIDAGGVLGVDAVSVVREARRTNPWVPVLVIGERERGCTSVEALRAGSDDYLARPFEVAELVARVHALVRRRGRSLPPARG